MLLVEEVAGLTVGDPCELLLYFRHGVFARSTGLAGIKISMSPGCANSVLTKIWSIGWVLCLDTLLRPKGSRTLVFNGQSPCQLLVEVSFRLIVTACIRK
jgi:hypothetical protein